MVIAAALLISKIKCATNHLNIHTLHFLLLPIILQISVLSVGTESDS